MSVPKLGNVRTLFFYYSWINTHSLFQRWMCVAAEARLIRQFCLTKVRLSVSRSFIPNGRSSCSSALHYRDRYFYKEKGSHWFRDWDGPVHYDTLGLWQSNLPRWVHSYSSSCGKTPNGSHLKKEGLLWFVVWRWGPSGLLSTRQRVTIVVQRKREMSSAGTQLCLSFYLTHEMVPPTHTASHSQVHEGEPHYFYCAVSTRYL